MLHNKTKGRERLRYHTRKKRGRNSLCPLKTVYTLPWVHTLNLSIIMVLRVWSPWWFMILGMNHYGTEGMESMMVHDIGHEPSLNLMWLKQHCKVLVPRLGQTLLHLLGLLPCEPLPKRTFAQKLKSNGKFTVKICHIPYVLVQMIPQE